MVIREVMMFEAFTCLRCLLFQFSFRNSEFYCPSWKRRVSVYRMSFRRLSPPFVLCITLVELPSIRIIAKFGPRSFKYDC